MQIDLEPREHSSRYEIKPESRWWLAFAIAFTLVMAVASGFFQAHTWAMFICGGLVVGYAVLCFPKTFLTKLRR